ncbi:ChbG/HpnK family deacetylase [Promicromonospora citrea]|nr:ChbG/HpnK family deacetylase [Promicromonospora citrea]
MTRSLVLTADDAGTDPDADREIAALLAGSPLTAVGVIAVPDRDGGSDLPGVERIAGLLARTAPGVAPGVHVALPEPEPAGGLDDVADRITAQADAVAHAAAAAGLPAPDRLDSHKGTLYGLHGRSYLPEAIGVCARRGLAFRLPRGLELYGDGDPLLSSPAVRERHAAAVAAADAAGVRLPRAIATHRGGDAGAGDYVALRDHYLRLLGRLPEGTSEIFLHPAPETERLRAAAPGWWRARTWELRLLGDPVFAREIDRQGIGLVARW